MNVEKISRNQLAGALLFFVVLTLMACSNSEGEGVANASAQNETASVSALEHTGGPEINFTGNVPYDMGLLNDYWKSLGSALDERNAILGGNTSNVLMKSDVKSTSSYSFDLSKALGKGVFKWLNDFGGSKIKNPLLKGVYQLGVNEVAKALGFADATNSQVLKAVNEVLDEVKAMQNQLKNMQDHIEAYADSAYRAGAEWQDARSRILARNTAYNEHQVHLENNFYAAIHSVLYRTVNASGVGDFKSIDDWNALSDEERGKYTADEKYKAYMEEKEDSLAEEIKTVILDWGDKSVAGSMAANGAFDIVKMLTDSIRIANNTVVKSYADLYELLAYESVVWESEGYEWRQQMINEDIAFVAKLSMATSWYYFLKKNDQAISNLQKYNELLVNYAENYKVVRHSTPIYVKWRSKYRDQIFEQKLKEIDYNKLLMNSWKYTGTQDRDNLIPQSKCLDERYYKWNASRLYAGEAPKKVEVENKKDTDAAYNEVWSNAATLAMSEDFYKEVFNSYQVDASNGAKRLSLVEIFERAGFTGMKEGTYQKGKNEQYFLTNFRTYAIAFNLSQTVGDRIYELQVPAVLANTDGNIMRFDNTSHHSVAMSRFLAHYVSHWNKSWHEETDHTDSHRLPEFTMQQIMDCNTESCMELRQHPDWKQVEERYFSRTFFYPVKTNKAVAIKE